MNGSGSPRNRRSIRDRPRIYSDWPGIVPASIHIAPGSRDRPAIDPNRSGIEPISTRSRSGSTRCRSGVDPQSVVDPRSAWGDPIRSTVVPGPIRIHHGPGAPSRRSIRIDPKSIRDRSGAGRESVGRRPDPARCWPRLDPGSARNRCSIRDRPGIDPGRPWIGPGSIHIDPGPIRSPR